jgi:hypothetical protein
VALAGSDGELDLYYDQNQPASARASLTAVRGGAVAVRVRAARLSTFINETVDFLKIDIEGAEVEVLQELAASGKMNQIRQMVIEFHHHVTPNDDRMARFLNILEEQGYGYQLRTPIQRPVDLGSFQDILVYAYKKTSQAPIN